MSGMTENSEWRKRIHSSPEAQHVRTSLEFQRKKIRLFQEELSSAECFETELEDRLKTVENRVKPALMTLVEKLNEDTEVDLVTMQKAVEEVKDPVKIISVMKKKSNKLSRMMRWQLLRFMKTLLVLRRCFLERNLAGLEDVQDMVNSGFKLLNLEDWQDMTASEVETTNQLVGEISGIPSFLVNLLKQRLAKDDASQ